MGTYTDLCVSDYSLFSTKSAVEPRLMTVFRERDRKVVEVREPDEERRTVTYSCRVWEAAARLDVMGFTLARARDEFTRFNEEEAERYTSWSEESELKDTWRRRAAFHRRLTFDDYLRVLSTILAERLERRYFDRFDPLDEDYSDDVVRTYILSEHDESHWGFTPGDPRFVLRAACSVSDPSALVVQDVSGLCCGGYYEPDEPICQRAVESLTASTPEDAPVIVLTEGPSDRETLSASLALLYPHLVDYYTFFDFEAFRSPGGVGPLGAMVKAFAGAGIANRVVAVFDNDTAACDARRTLPPLPPNVVHVSYPPLDLLRDYPTVGPTGSARADVNGRAGSIEMYFGRDVLEDAGDLVPVRWGAYSEGAKQHQGEVLRKGELQARFREKVARSRADSETFKRADWTGVAAILEVVFAAFRDPLPSAQGA